MPRFFFKYLIILICIITVGFSYGYLKTFLSFKSPNENPELDINNIEREVSKIPEIKLNAGAKLRYITYYVGCGHKIIEEDIIDETYVGLSKTEIQQKEVDWVIDSFTPNEVILKREESGICGNHYYIGIQNGYVALFQGVPGMQSTLVEQTDIMADILREDDRLILEKGLIIYDEQEFLKIREGLTK